MFVSADDCRMIYSDSGLAMTAIGYARVSTADQVLDLQIDALRAAGCERIFEDTASGVKTARPGLEKALAFTRDGDVLVVWKLDRLGRSVGHLVETVQRVETAGAGFRSLTEGIDTRTTTGRLLLHLFASLAQFECDLIQDRINAGVKAAKARGRSVERPPVMDDIKVRQCRSDDRCRTTYPWGGGQAHRGRPEHNAELAARPALVA